jgi:hypothetical protein
VHALAPAPASGPRRDFVVLLPAGYETEGLAQPNFLPQIKQLLALFPQRTDLLLPKKASPGREDLPGSITRIRGNKCETREGGPLACPSCLLRGPGWRCGPALARGGRGDLGGQLL